MYATQQDIEERYPNLLDTIADADGDGVAEAATVAMALADAGEEINLYVGKRYQLPLATVPGVLKRLAVDIGIYRVALTCSPGTDEQRQRYEDALAVLRRISKGEVSLGISETSAPATTTIEIDAGTPVFDKDSMKGF